MAPARSRRSSTRSAMRCGRPHEPGDAARLRALRRRPAGRGPGRSDLQLRMHVLRPLRRGARRPLPELRRRAGPAADSGQGAARAAPAVDRAAVRRSMTAPPRILAIAGSDSSGGAGIQADIKTITMLGGYAMTAVTAITAQNSLGVSAVEALSPALVGAQIDACLSDI